MEVESRNLMYQTYQAQADITAQVSGWARIASTMLRNPFADALAPYGMRRFTAGLDLLGRAGIVHTRPAFGIDSTLVGEAEVPVREVIADKTAFASLIHFEKTVDSALPRVLVVAPMSGHFSTLLRATVRTMLPDHDVFLTDWHNARDVRVADGKFGNDEYVAHIMRFIEKIGPGSHVIAVCQPCVPVLAAVAIMAESGNVAQPRSMTLMAGPIDARINPTAVNKLASSHSMDWFEHLISTVPARYRGAGRRVYPGFLQLTGFIAMNAERHAKAHWDLYNDLATGEDAKAKTIAEFYDEYFAVADLPAEFYLDTVRSVFQAYDLACGTLEWRGRRVRPGAIERTSLLTVEGERDDVCGIGQTMAAHELCTGIRTYRKRHHFQAGVGHYGVFSGSRWTRQIYPVLRNVILAAN